MLLALGPDEEEPSLEYESEETRKEGALVHAHIGLLTPKHSGKLL